MNMRLGVLGSTFTLAVLSLSSLLYAREPASEADKVFVGKVSQGGMYEVEASKLAEQKSHMPDTRDLAVMEVHDHTLVNAGLKKIATAKGIAVSPALNATFRQRLEKLKSNSGPEFDAAYIADMKEIHDNDEKLFAKEASEGSDSFKAFAHETDLIVKRHIGALHGLDAN